MPIRRPMDRGLYIAASGMLAEQVRQEQIANDLSNSSTAGFKRDRVTQTSFNSLLLANSTTGATIGSQSTAVQVDAQNTDWTPQPSEQTDEPLDFAITGDGFFSVATPQGTAYTRNGQFSSNAQGQLTDSGGNTVLGRGGGPITVAADGTVDPGLLAVTNLTNPRKQGGNLVAGTPTGGGTGQVQAGALEESGADPARSMVDMIASMRAFEAAQRAITTIDSTLGKSVSSVGAISG
jgi:flagellar basal-body rod protein FlgF